MTDYKNLKLRASSNPHIRNRARTRSGLCSTSSSPCARPALRRVHFGVRVAISAVVSVASAIFFEWLYRKAAAQAPDDRRPVRRRHRPAAEHGLPPELPVWMLVVGNFFAIFVVKQLYGGLGKNFLNPALAARAALVACYGPPP